MSRSPNILPSCAKLNITLVGLLNKLGPGKKGESTNKIVSKFIPIIAFHCFLVIGLYVSCRAIIAANLFISPTLWRISTQFWAALRHKRGVYFFPQDTVSCLQGVKGRNYFL